MKELYPGDQGIWVQYLQLALQRAGQQVMLDGIFDQRPVQPWKSNGQQRKVCGKRSTVEPSTALLRGYITHEVKAGDTFSPLRKCMIQRWSE